VSKNGATLFNDKKRRGPDRKDGRRQFSPDEVFDVGMDMGSFVSKSYK
jgi:hypothetical protein